MTLTLTLSCVFSSSMCCCSRLLIHSSLSSIAGPRFLSAFKVTRYLFEQRVFIWDFCKNDKLEDNFCVWWRKLLSAALQNVHILFPRAFQLWQVTNLLILRKSSWGCPLGVASRKNDFSSDIISKSGKWFTEIFGWFVSLHTKFQSKFQCASDTIWKLPSCAKVMIHHLIRSIEIVRRCHLTNSFFKVLSSW